LVDIFFGPPEDSPMTSPDVDVAPLLPAARGGSQKALGDVLEACRKYLLWVARKQIDADLVPKGGASDLVQETLLEAHRDFDRFAGGSEAELLAWLRRLLLNNISNFIRQYRGTGKRGVDREVPLTTARGGSAPDEAPGEQLERREQVELLFRLIKRLPIEHRQVINLWYEDHSFEEIGRLMGRSTNAARMLWMRAIEGVHKLAAAG
jgi:RNA polymerase sigma-70 factor, ECF subfamily